MAGRWNDTDRFADALLPHVNDLSESELDELIDSKAVTRRYFDVVAGCVGRARVRCSVQREQGSSAGMPETIRALTTYVQGELFARFRSSSSSSFDVGAWEGTHIAARALRRVGSASAADRAYLLNGIFDVLDEVEGATEDDSSKLDGFWPKLELLEELGREACVEPALSGVYAKRYGRLAAVAPSEAAASCLAWGVNELLERGAVSKKLAARVAEELVRADASDLTSCILALLVRLRPREKALRVVLESRTLGKYARDLVDPLFAQTERATTSMKGYLSKFDPDDSSLNPPDEFLSLVAIARTGTPLAGVCAMAAIKLTLCNLYETLEQKVVRARELAVARLCSLILDEVAGSRRGVAFLSCEAIEGLRDRFPSASAAAVAEMVAEARPVARQGMFVLIAEGYEEQFRGDRQVEVPHFEERNGRFRFVSPAGFAGLDVFGKRVARLAESKADVRQHTDWMNDRLSGWLAVAST